MNNSKLEQLQASIGAIAEIMKMQVEAFTANGFTREEAINIALEFFISQFNNSGEAEI